MSPFKGLKERMFQTTEAFVFSLTKPSEALREYLLPRPEDVIREQTGLDLSALDLCCLAEQFCADYERAPLAHLTVHDALHVILKQPPTAEGESAVVAWQFRNYCFDHNVMAVWQIVLSALAVNGYRELPALALKVYEQFVRRREANLADLPKRLLEVSFWHS